MGRNAIYGLCALSTLMSACKYRDIWVCEDGGEDWGTALTHRNWIMHGTFYAQYMLWLKRREITCTQNSLDSIEQSEFGGGFAKASPISYDNNITFRRLTFSSSNCRRIHGNRTSRTARGQTARGSWITWNVARHIVDQTIWEQYGTKLLIPVYHI